MAKTYVEPKEYFTKEMLEILNEKEKDPVEEQKNIQSYIANISTTKSLEEIITLYENTERITALDSLFEEDAYVEWTAPKWIKKDDIVFFMYSVTSIQTIKHLTKQFIQNINYFSTDAKELIKNSLSQSEIQYNKFGGCIFAIGRVTGTLINDDYATENDMHWKSHIYAPISDITFLENPIPHNVFKKFINLSMQSSITGVFGEEYNQLKSLIISKNNVPDYFKDSYASPLPLSKIDKSNWLKYANDYRRSFFLEIQFRTFYTNYLLSELGDIKTIYRECPCIKGNIHPSFVDNVILFKKQYLPVEIKLSVTAEKDLPGQCEKYCNLDKLILDSKTNREADLGKVVSNRVLVIDTDGIYIYKNEKHALEQLFELDKLTKLDQIEILKKLISSELTL